MALEKIRSPKKVIPAKKAAVYSAGIALAGLLVGVGIKFLDIYTEGLGNIFSQMSVWIFLCSVLAAYSSTPRRAAVNVLLFCASMLPAYYITAEATGSSYSMIFVWGWAIFALFSPALAFATWYAKGKSVLSKWLTGGILGIMLIVAVVMFDKIRLSDLIFAGLTAIMLLKS